MESIPRIDKTVARLPTIQGVVPSLLDLPSGCRFQNRCPRATEQCRATQPPLTSIGGGRKVACYHPYT
jgi:oligopeptide/dipeptide ABC transporter ATP-binding protein